MQTTSTYPLLSSFSNQKKDKQKASSLPELHLGADLNKQKGEKP